MEMERLYANGHTTVTPAALVEAAPGAEASVTMPKEQVFVLANNEKYGPFTSDQIRGYVAGGKFRRHHLILLARRHD